MRRKIRVFKIVLTALMLLFIWGNSMFSGETSAAESGLVLEFLEPILSHVLPTVQSILSRFGIYADEMAALRKLAHFSEYAILGILLSFLLVQQNGLPRFLLSEALCAVTAGIDESIQIFSEGRTPSVRDVIIDFSGATLGCVVLTAILLLVWIGRRRKRARQRS